MQPLPVQPDSAPKTQSRPTVTAARWWIAVLFLAGLACGQATVGPPPTIRISRLPTLTPTAALGPAAPAAAAVAVPPVSPVETPPAAPVTAPTPPAPAAPAAAPAQSGWQFSAVRQTAWPAGLLLTGQLQNNTGGPQIIQRVVATFFDAQGQQIAGPDTVQHSVPLEIVPPGGSLPFKVTAPGIQTAEDFELAVEAAPGNLVPRQDFQFIGLEQSIQAGDYCLTGQMKNPGGALQNKLLITLLLYDEQEKLINFSTHNE
ncbi:MAG: hypothetical protein D6768_03860, partial [Chloroflexi bacterium]